MNEPSPLVPQGSFESQARRKSHVRIAVFSILAIHVVVLGGLLILGCKRDDSKGTETAGEPPLTNDLTAPPFGGTEVIATNAIAQAVPTNSAPTGVSSPGTTVPPVTPPPTTPVPEAGAAMTHVIAKGESFATLATKYGVSVKGIQEANPNLVPTKLQIGDKVQIPPKTAIIPRTVPPAADASDVHTVKTGDTLSKIASTHRTTVKELQRLNNLPTTQIRVGQKLKLPPATAPASPGGVPPAQ